MSKLGHLLCLKCMTPMDGYGACPACHWQDDHRYDLQCARPGTVLSGRYLLGLPLRKNGGGVLYAGFDNSLQQKVWIWEYFPQTIAQRSLETGKIMPLAGCGAQYKALASDFVDICNEIRRLGVTEPVVPLENVLSEHNTIYAVFQGLDLITFEEYLEQQGGRLSPKHALTLLLPICSTLGTLHSHGQIHRGVSPYTIYADRDGKLYLWEFSLSATRTAGSELDAQLFTGYSAPEQYSPSGWQGSWTDVYAMGALLYRTLTGIVPPKSIRIDGDRPLAALSEQLPYLPQNISDAVSAAMEPDTQERIQAMQTFVSRMVESKADSTAVYDTSRVIQAGGPKEPPPPAMKEERPRQSTAKYVVLGMLVMLLLLGGAIWFFVTSMLPGIIQPEPAGPAAVGQEHSLSQPAGEDASQPGDDRMPSFFNKLFSDVRNNPEYSRFQFTVKEEFDSNYPQGTIIDQRPVEGEPIYATGTISVEITVSKGPVRHEMPDVIGRTMTEATEILGNLEGVNIEIMQRYDATARPGDVVSTTPEPGVEFDPKRQTVYLFIMPEVSVEEGTSRPSRRDDEITLGGDDGSRNPWIRDR